jgi:pimeloyl-ACP methyl ester carboxylesterase
VDGALCWRANGPARPLAAALADRFTVVTYDRRGRGDSGDAPGSYSVDREVEDLAVVVAAAGGSAHVFGQSSGAALALEAASRLEGITRHAVYEAPFIVDDSHPPRPADLRDRMEALVEADRRSDAVRLFLRTVGLPAPAVAVMRLLPLWRRLTGVATRRAQKASATTSGSSRTASPRASGSPPVEPSATPRGRQRAARRPRRTRR